MPLTLTIEGGGQVIAHDVLISNSGIHKAKLSFSANRKNKIVRQAACPTIENWTTELEAMAKKDFYFKGFGNASGVFCTMEHMLTFASRFDLKLAEWVESARPGDCHATPHGLLCICITADNEGFGQLNSTNRKDSIYGRKLTVD